MDIILVVGMIVFSISLGYSVGRRMCVEAMLPFIDKDSRRGVLHLFNVPCSLRIRRWL